MTQRSVSSAGSSAGQHTEGRSDIRPPLGAAAAASGRPRPRGRWRKPVEIAVLLAPALLLYVVFVLLPVAQAGYYSLYKWNGLDPLTDFVGLENYRRALADPVFIKALSHNGIFVVLSLVVQLPIGLGLAILLNRKIKLIGFYRTCFLVPFVASAAAEGLLFGFIFDPDFGIVNAWRSIGSLARAL